MGGQKFCSSVYIMWLDKLLLLIISPSQYPLLQNCQASSASVERSFSKLKKLLVKDRTFKDNNIKKYFIVYYNKNQESSCDWMFKYILKS